MRLFSAHIDSFVTYYVGISRVLEVGFCFFCYLMEMSVCSSHLHSLILTYVVSFLICKSLYKCVSGGFPLFCYLTLTPVSSSRSHL